MRRVILSVVTAAGALMVAALPGLAATTSPGKNSVFVSATAIPLPAASVTLLSGTIAKGKKKKALSLEAMLTNGPYATPVVLGVTLSLMPLVNGVAMEPTTSGGQGAVVDCTFAPAAACTVTGTWWLDLDAAEAASPGMFIGKPLNITLTGGSLTGGLGSPFDVTFTARLEAK